MIFICTSMYFEAEPIIKKLNLKKDLNFSKFEIFSSSKVTLIITGTGKIKSAIALTYILSTHNLTSSDMFINIGIAGCSNRNISIGQVFLCDKITDNDTGKTLFSDILFKHPFDEASLTTYSVPVKHCSTNELVDMEASALFESALTFLQPHQLFFIKIVSDYLTPNELSPKNISILISENIDLILNWILELQEKFIYDKKILSDESTNLINNISENLKFSSSMKNEFKQLITYSSITNDDVSINLKKFADLNCKSKKEGKMYLEKIRSELI